MNYKHLITILLLLACLAIPASAVSAHYENKYVATNNEIPSDGCGQLVITTLTKHALIGAAFTLIRVDPGNFTFTNGQRIDKIQYDALVKQGEDYDFVLDHNGQWDDRIAPGTYGIYKPEDNGGQPAYAIATVTEGYLTTVVFQGHGVSSGGEHKIIYMILKATYGATACNQVIDTPAHTEYRYWIDAAGHWSGPWYNRRWIIDTPAHWSEWSNTHPHSCDHQTRTVPATYRTECTGETTDVTQNVQRVVNMGYTQFIFFDNAQMPGGIFSSDNTLLSEIIDPAPGIVKNVYIHYIRDGEDRTINTQEYQKINL